MKSSRQHVDFLDHLRGVAVLAVLLFHALGTVYGFDVLPWHGWFRSFSVPASFLWFLPISLAQMGVPIFFVVSGFCIHMSFQQQGQQWGSFFIRRIFRIYPAYLAALFFFALLYREHCHLDFGSPQMVTQLLTHFFFVHNFSNTTIGGINGSFWSLAVEAQLYLLYPALLFLVAKLGWRRALVILAGCELLIRGTDALMETLNATNTFGGHISWLFTISPLGYWFSWALGAFIADAFLKKQSLPFLKASAAGWTVLVILCYFVKPLYSFRFLLFAVITAVVLSKFLNRPKSNVTVFSRSRNVLKKIGLWSYSIYLLHQPILQILSYVMSWLVPEGYQTAPLALLLLVAWPAVIPISILWYELFELPGITLGKRILQKMENCQTAKPDGERLPEKIVIASNRRRYGVMACAGLLLTGGIYFAGVKLTPPEPDYNNNLAWSLATSPEATKRDGPRAVALAEDACQRTQYKETIMIGTLAAAYAEAGRFEQAVLTAQAACELAAKNGETNLLQRNQELLQLYQSHQPYRDRQPNP